MNYTFGGRMVTWRIELQARRRSRMSGIRRCGLVVVGATRRRLAQGLRVGRWSLGRTKCDDVVSCLCPYLCQWLCGLWECFDFGSSRRFAAVWAVSRASNSRVCSWPRSIPRQTPLTWICWVRNNSEPTPGPGGSHCSDAKKLP